MFEAFEYKGKLDELRGVLMTMVAIDQLQHASSQVTAQQNFQSPIDLLSDNLKKVFLRLLIQLKKGCATFVKHPINQ